jgi:tRNA-dihydrouridine synthase
MERLIDCGVDLITVHGRSRFENKVAVGAAKWDFIQRCVAAARSYSGDKLYPVFANGGIEMFSDVVDCLQATSASGLMSSESLLENPGLFSKNDNLQSESAKQMLERQLSYADMYLDYATLFPPLPGSLGAQGGSFNVIRSHLFKFLHRYFEENPDLRCQLGDNGFNSIKEARELVLELRQRYDTFDEEELTTKSSSSVNSSWYRRHRSPDVPASKAIPTIDPVISSEEKKRRARERIQKMRDQRLDKELKLTA